MQRLFLPYFNDYIIVLSARICLIILINPITLLLVCYAKAILDIDLDVSSSFQYVLKELTIEPVRLLQYYRRGVFSILLVLLFYQAKYQAPSYRCCLEGVVKPLSLCLTINFPIMLRQLIHTTVLLIVIISLL